MGTPEFACPSLKALNEHFNVKAVVTAPDRPSGRGQKLQPSAVKVCAQDLGLDVLQPVKLRNPEFLDQLASYKADLFVVLAFRMLPKIVWDSCPMGTINLHASLLPQYRGAAPINWAVINGESESGLTTFFIQEEIDTGDILMQKRMEIGKTETAGSLHDRMMEEGAALLVETVDLLQAEKLKPTPQSNFADSELKSAPKIFKEHCKISWNQPAKQVFNLIRGMSPYPGAETEMQLTAQEKSMAKILKASLSERVCDKKPGEVLIEGKNLWVACADEWLQIDEIKAAGKRKMAVQDWLNGLKEPQNLQFY